MGLTLICHWLKLMTLTCELLNIKLDLNTLMSQPSEANHDFFLFLFFSFFIFRELDPRAFDTNLREDAMKSNDDYKHLRY